MPNDIRRAADEPPPLFSREPPRERETFCTDSYTGATAGNPLTHRDPSPTEAAAAERIKPVRRNLRVRVLARIRTAGAEGMTAPELGGWYAREKGDAHPSARREYAVRPRTTELLRAGYITQAGGQRGGCTVFIATDKAGDGSDCPAAPTAAPRMNAAARVLARELLDALGEYLNHRGAADLQRLQIAKDTMRQLIEVPR